MHEAFQKGLFLSPQPLKVNTFILFNLLKWSSTEWLTTWLLEPSFCWGHIRPMANLPQNNLGTFQGKYSVDQPLTKLQFEFYLRSMESLTSTVQFFYFFSLSLFLLVSLCQRKCLCNNVLVHVQQTGSTNCRPECYTLIIPAFHFCSSLSKHMVTAYWHIK